MKRSSDFRPSGHDDFDRLADLVSKSLRVPCVLFSILTRDQPRWLASVGYSSTNANDYWADAHDLPQDTSFSVRCAANDGMLRVYDALGDAKLARNPLVLKPPNVRSYAGVQLRNRDGSIIGAVSIFDRLPRHFSSHECAMLIDFAAVVRNTIELRRTDLEEWTIPGCRAALLPR